MERQILSLDHGWRFHEGEVSFNKYSWHDILYMSTRSASGKGAARRDFDDRDWRVVNVPHDYVVEGVPTQEAAPSHGSLVRNNAWYRRAFKLAEADQGKYIALHFEGICSTCEIWVNGIPMMHNYTAGVGFELDITDVARYGEDINVIAVYIDNHDYEGWYYEGGGIYRHVWLVKTGKVHVDTWGTFVISNPLEGGEWSSRIETEIRNDYEQETEITVVSEILDPNGEVAVSVSSKVQMDARDLRKVIQEINVTDVKVWDIETPNIYKLHTTILRADEVEDTYLTDFGYRTIKYTADDGFYLNGKKTFIVGYGSHQDLTGFGVGITDSISEFKMRRLQSMGFNLFRTAHNPFAPALYDACDKIGLMCMDENRRFISSPEVVDELTRMIKRDRNHPSIIMWSLFNEEDNRVIETGQAVYRTLASVAHKLDPTRPATGADNTATAIPGAMNDIELIGINHVYTYDALDKVRENNPHKPIYFSETGLTKEILMYVKTRPYIFAAFGWGGLPYRGETKWPQLHDGSSDPANMVFSLLCDPEDMFYWNKAAWTREPVVKIITQWTHPGKEGSVIPVLVYTNADEVELFLNGESLGRKSVNDIDCEGIWNVVYEPGVLSAKGYYTDKVLTDEVETVGEAKALALSLENGSIRKNGRDTAIISAYLVDEQGRKLPKGPGSLVKFTVVQGGSFLCVGSPDKADHASWQIPEVHLYENKAQVYVESDALEDLLTIEAVVEGYAPASITITKAAADSIPEVPVEDNKFIYQFYISPTRINEIMPDLDAFHADKPDMSNWIYFEVGRGNSDSFSMLPRQGMGDSSIQSARIVYYAKTKVPVNSSKFKKTRLVMEKFEGKGKVVVFGPNNLRFEAAKEIYPPTPLEVDTTGLQEGDEVEVWAVVEADTMFCGVIRPVRWCFE